jgi:transposase
MPQRNVPRSAAVYGIDIGKNIFHVVGLGSDGVPVQKVRFRRDTLLQFFERAAPAIVGMESCAGSQWIARKIQALGHKVRLIPAQFVKPYVKSNKTDIIDAEAIAEAATRPTMRFAALKSEEQADLQALHRVRDQMIGTRTRLINQMRAFCLEYGIALRQGARVFSSLTCHRFSKTNQTTFRRRCGSCSQICLPICANWSTVSVTSHARSKP